MENLSLKEQKEAFVTGHDGSTVWEVLLVCASAPIGLACYRSLVSVLRLQRKRSCMVLEAFVVWFPLVLNQTKYLYPYGIGVLVLQARMAHIFGSYARDNDHHPHGPNYSTKQRVHFLTAYRSSILYLTFVAILAVDFHVFPRRFCKTETSGFGLMDVGAASFVISGGIVSPRARGKVSSRAKLWKHITIHVLPLVTIGVIRIITNQELEYQEHVTEYGIHWNFFFTLGVLALIPLLLTFRRPTWLLPILILGCYQTALVVGGIQEFVETAPRHGGGYCSESHALCNFFLANREGILGCIGYITLFLFGEWVGHRYIWTKSVSSALPFQRNGLFSLSLLLWSFLALFHWVWQLPVSRRSTNAIFCLWAAAHNVLLLAILQWVIPPTSKRGKLPVVWETVNEHGLLMFLIANLLTGLVNISIPTLEIADPWALGIIFAYVCAIGAAALLLDTVWTIISRRRSRKTTDAKQD